MAYSIDSDDATNLYLGVVLFLVVIVSGELAIAVGSGPATAASDFRWEHQFLVVIVSCNESVISLELSLCYCC